MFQTVRPDATVRIASLIAAVNAGDPTVLVVLRTNTLSAADCLYSSPSTAATCPDSPGPVLVGSIFFVPRALPIANAATTNASQPNVAVFQCEALQRPMRAARCFEVPRGVIGLRLSV